MAPVNGMVLPLVLALRPFFYRSVWNNISVSRSCLRSMCSGSNAAGGGTAKKPSSRDPSPTFLQPQVQNLLYKVTGFNLGKIFPRRYVGDPSPPTYQLLTDRQLQQIEVAATAKGREHLVMPPFMKARVDTAGIISQDPEIDGFADSKYVFTDITFGLPNRKRAVVVRETTGELRHATPSERDHILQIYYSRPGRVLHMPDMFKEEHLERLLTEGEYLYVLDRACVQFEPDDPHFIRVTHRTYEHIAEHNQFDCLRSTRYFGTLTFYFVFYKNIERLLVDMIQRNMLEDAADTVRLYHIVHPECQSARTVEEQGITDQQLLVQEYAKYDAEHGGLVELALQTYNETQESAVGQQ